MGSFSGFWRTLKVLWTWGDQLAPFFEALPRNLAVAGDAMVIGGEGALRAGQAFNGAAATSVQQMLEAVAAAVASCNRELDAVAGQLESAGQSHGGASRVTVCPCRANACAHGSARRLIVPFGRSPNVPTKRKC